MTHGSLFSGIGGFDLAAHWMGWHNTFHVERDPFCRQILKHHFPESQAYDDIKTFDATDFRGRIDVLSGGWPCQPWSAAGQRKGTMDERHLWPEMLRIVQECAPRYVVGENVRGLLSWGGGVQFESCCADLETCGYDVQPFVLPAASVNAPHQRLRLFVVAHANDDRADVELRGERSRSESDGGRITESEYRSHGGDGHVANAGSVGRERRGSQEGACERTGERVGVQPDVEGQSKGGNATDTDGKFRPEGRMHASRSQETERHVSARDARPVTWEDFPTETPLCGGDDGLPERLDRITFSKWRKAVSRPFS